MEGANILYGNIDDLKNIQGALMAQSSLRGQIQQENIKKQNLTKDIESEEKLLKETIDATVKKRREQVLSNFDREMSKVQDRLKNTRNERTRAKNKGVEARIKEETSEIIQENKNLKDEIRTIFRQKGVWKYFDNKLTYILYYPKTAKEKVLFLLLAAMGIIVIPTLAVWLTNAFWLLRVLEYIVIAAIFVTLYIVGYKYARVEYKDAFLETKVQRSTIIKNESKIKRIIRSIKKDKDDERYGLESFDSEIKELEQQISEIVARKNNAVNDFERTTKADIEEEITARDIGKIEKLKKEQNEAAIKLKELEQQQKNITIDISTNYTAYIGEENMNTESIEKMMVLLADGRAKTIGDAINILKNAQ